MHGKIDRNILVTINEIICDQYVQRWHKPGYCIAMEMCTIQIERVNYEKNIYNQDMYYEKVFLWQMMLSLAFLWWDWIALWLRSSSSSYALLPIWEINWRFDYHLCHQVTICLHSEWMATDLCARESTDRDLCDHGDQLETNQGSINVLEDLSALHGALWLSHRAPQIAA